MTLSQLFLPLLLGLGIVHTAGAAPSSPGKSSGPHTRAELLAEVESIRPGQPFTVALRLSMDKEWHTYWQNPGDSGYPTEIEWTLPDGFTAGPLQWPIPARIGDRENLTYGYHDQVLLLTEIQPPADLAPGTPVTLKATASWLECREACLPGEAKLQLELPVAAHGGKAVKGLRKDFGRTRQNLPLATSPWKVAARLLDNGYRLELTPPAPDCVCGPLVFLPSDGAVVDHGAPQTTRKETEHIVVELLPSPFLEEPPERLRGVLVSTVGWNGAGSPVALAIDVPLLP